MQSLLRTFSVSKMFCPSKRLPVHFEGLKSEEWNGKSSKRGSHRGCVPSGITVLIQSEGVFHQLANGKEINMATQMLVFIEKLI